MENNSSVGGNCNSNRCRKSVKSNKGGCDSCPANSSNGGSKTKKDCVEKKKATRKPSAYNKFMSSEIKKLQKSNPTLSHTERFKKAAAAWKTHPSNPKK